MSLWDIALAITYPAGGAIALYITVRFVRRRTKRRSSQRR